MNRAYNSYRVTREGRKEKGEGGRDKKGRKTTRGQTTGEPPEQGIKSAKEIRRRPTKKIKKKKKGKGRGETERKERKGGEKKGRRGREARRAKGKARQPIL